VIKFIVIPVISQSQSYLHRRSLTITNIFISTLYSGPATGWLYGGTMQYYSEVSTKRSVR